MTSLSRIGPFVLVGVALLFSCVLWLVPSAIWDLPVLPRPLMVYGEYPTCITMPALITSFMSLALLWATKPIKLKSVTAIVLVALIILTIAITLYAVFQNAFLSNVTIGRLNNAGYTYYLTLHDRVYARAYNLYKCNTDNLMCYRIPFSIPPDKMSPHFLHADPMQSGVYIIDWNGETIYEYKSPDEPND